jgi:hypothetical protein
LPSRVEGRARDRKSTQDSAQLLRGWPWTGLIASELLLKFEVVTKLVQCFLGIRGKILAG